MGSGHPLLGSHLHTPVRFRESHKISGPAPDFFLFNCPLQFFDSDGDGMVSKDDLSRHLPFRSLPSGLNGNGHQQRQGCDYEGAFPNQMNMGE